MGSISNSSTALVVNIVGGGLVGLSAAVSLRQAGHNVTVFEKSAFFHEVGAAVTMSSPLTKIMTEWGIDLKAAGATPYLRQAILSAANLQNLKPISSNNYEAVFGYPFYTIHRADSHNALRELATSPTGPGTPVSIRRLSAVQSYDATTATLTLHNNTTDTADLLILADGLHSTAASSIHDIPACPIVPSPQVVCRFLIPSDAILSDPITAPLLPDPIIAPLLPEPNSIDFYFSPDRYLVRYPCRDNILQNFALYITSPPNDADDKDKYGQQVSDSHGKKVTRQDLHDAMEKGGFAPALLALSEKVEEVLPLWRCYDRKPLPRCTKGKCVMIGDASHPMLPHKGVLFGESHESGQEATVEEKLQAFERLRTARVGCVQLYSGMHLMGDAGSVWQECEAWVGGPVGDKGQKMSTEDLERLTGVDVEALPRENEEVIKWLLMYDVVKDTRRVMAERGL